MKQRQTARSVGVGFSPEARGEPRTNYEVRRIYFI